MVSKYRNLEVKILAKFMKHIKCFFPPRTSLVNFGNLAFGAKSPLPLHYFLAKLKYLQGQKTIIFLLILKSFV